MLFVSARCQHSRQVVTAGSQGKYFWCVSSFYSCIGTVLNALKRITFEKPPHLVMHFGMTGTSTI